MLPGVDLFQESATSTFFVGDATPVLLRHTMKSVVLTADVLRATRYSEYILRSIYYTYLTKLQK